MLSIDLTHGSRAVKCPRMNWPSAHTHFSVWQLNLCVNYEQDFKSASHSFNWWCLLEEMANTFSGYHEPFHSKQTHSNQVSHTLNNKNDIAKRERMFRKAKCSKPQDHLSQYKRLGNSIITVRFMVLKTPSLRSSLNLQHWIKSSGPSSGLWTHASLSLQVLSLMLQSQLMASRTKPIFSTSSSPPVSTWHLFPLLFLIR